MLRIEDGFIYLTRGDTAYLNIDITYDDGRTYGVKVDDVLTLSLKRNIADIEYAVQKSISGSNRFILTPDDTKHLEYGKYLFDVQLVTAAGEVFTIISKSNFYIQEEVTE